MAKSRIEQAASAFADALFDERLDRTFHDNRAVCAQNGCVPCFGMAPRPIEQPAGKSPLQWRAVDGA